MAAALASKNPWQQLKAEATKPKKQFKFLTAKEQADYISRKAEERYGADTKPRKQREKQPRQTQQPRQVDPHQLRLYEGHFKDDQDVDIKQILLTQVVPDATGIAIQAKANLSTDALGLLVPEDIPGTDLGQTEHQHLRFAACHDPTQEPVLINGTLLQLGDTPIEHHIPGAKDMKIDVINTEIIKITLYKDEVATEWKEVAKGSVKFITQQNPKLMLCKGVCPGKMCTQYHNAVDEDTPSVIHEVWGRRFAKATGQTAKAEESVMFMAFLRVTASALTDILTVYAPGMYVEPRDPIQNAINTNYSVVWLPDLPREELLHRLRTELGAMGLVECDSAMVSESTPLKKKSCTRCYALTRNTSASGWTNGGSSILCLTGCKRPTCRRCSENGAGEPRHCSQAEDHTKERRGRLDHRSLHPNPLFQPLSRT